MASFKAVVLKGNKRNDGTYNINVRVTHNRKSKYINTGLVVTKDDVTKGFNLKNYFFIDETEKIIKKYRDICNKNAYAIKGMDVEQVFRLVTETERSEGTFIDIVEYGRKHAEYLMKNGKKGTAYAELSSLNNLIKFVGREQININQITAKLLRDWIDWIDGDRAKSLYPCYIRKLHNEAKREYNVEELGIIKIPLSPFSVVKLPKEPKPKDIDIPVAKVRELFALEDTDVRRYNFARDMFMLSFCLWGTNAKDLYECTEFRDGRLIYNRAKTKGRRDDAALISIKVEPEVIPLFEKYKDKTDKRVFCFYQMYSDSGTFNAAIAAITTGMISAMSAISKAQSAYEFGTDYHRGGSALVGEGRHAEWIQTPSGKTYLADKPTFFEKLPVGSSVTPLPEFSMKDSFMPKHRLPEFTSTDTIGNWNNAEIVQKLDRNNALMEQLLNKPTVNVDVSDKITAYIQSKLGKIKILNSKFGF